MARKSIQISHIRVLLRDWENENEEGKMSHNQSEVLHCAHIERDIQRGIYNGIY